MNHSTLFYALTLSLSLLASNPAFSDQVTVTTYVTKVQEERKSTRWTLTEWLRIKERMKMMDLWMAMFSDPAKDRFRPEINATWLVTQSAVQQSLDDVEGTPHAASGHTGKAQFWATNLISSTLGVRTLNLDFGIEAGQHSSGEGKATGNSSIDSSLGGQATTNWYTANLRLFGKSIQDSSLVLKYGMMQTKNQLQLPGDTTAYPSTTRPNSDIASGSVAGVELQLYVFNWLGAEATYHQYHPVDVAYRDHILNGQYGEALGFIEISVLRLMAGRYEERWDAKWDSYKTNSREWGYLAGLKLQI
jgi:hypothetical protein